MRLQYIVLIYVCIRLLSFFTYHLPVANQIIAVLLIAAFGYLSVKKLSTAWIILIAELLVDGAGHFFELQDFLLRTWFLGIFALVWLYQKIKEKKIQLNLPRYIMRGMGAVVVVLLWSILNGFLKDHAAIHILQDAILYGFLFLVFPALEFHKNLEKPFASIVKAFLIGSAAFSLLSFFIYTSGMGTLPDNYYHWFRNIAVGKITDLGDNFFRIVVSEHLYIVPIILVLTALLIKDWKNKMLWFYLFLSSIILSLNFSRIYFVALAAGMLFLTFKNSLKKWFLVSAGVTVCVLFSFSSLYFTASRGNSLGLELLGLRIGGATSPKAEVSGAIRLAILPNAIGTIKAHPWMGSGLGTTVTYVDPASQKEVTRTQFDWGYLEVIA